MMKKHVFVSLSLVISALGACGDDEPSSSNDAAVAIDLAIDLAHPADAAAPDLAQPSPDMAKPTDPRDAPGVFSAVGNHVRHVRSLDDGLTWVDDATDFDQSMMGDLYGIRTVAWCNGQFVAFAAKVLTSPDGKTYTEVPKADGQWLASMLYANGQYVSSGGYGWLATTTSDLGNWTQHPPHDNYTTAHHSRAALAHGVVAGIDAYVVVDDDGNLFHSGDGQTWLDTTGAPIVPAGLTWGTQLQFGGGVFVGLLPNGMDSIRSVDGGATWTSNTAFATAAQSIVYAQGHFTALGAGHAYTSVDGQSWVDHADASAPAADIVYGHFVYLANRNGDILRSTDGLSWTQVFTNGSNPDDVHSIAFGPL
jgi:hypothetical protein